MIEDDLDYCLKRNRAVLTLADHVYKEANEELVRAVCKFPTWPTNAIHALAVVNEEIGELQKEVLQFTYETHKTNFEKVRNEAIQAHAMLTRFIISLDRYVFSKSSQHEQI